MPITSSNQAYFDCNATTPTLPTAAEAALNAMQTLYGNPSSTHRVGLQAKAILEVARKHAGQVLGCVTDRIIFTSGATEAIQTAVFSALQAARARGCDSNATLLYGATEHKAVPQAIQHWVTSLGLPYKIVALPVDSSGRLKLEALEAALPHAALLCTMAVNNETGVIQDLAAVQEVLLRSRSQALWMVDCVQALGKLPLNLSSTRIDYAAFSGHKVYAPKGIGMLYVSENAPLTPLIVGGGQERGLRSGTENLPGVAALGAILELLLAKPGRLSVLRTGAELLVFRDRIVTELRRAFPKVEFNTPFEVAVPTTINFSVPGFSSLELMDLFDSAGLRVSAGSACNSTSVKPSHVLEAMGLSEWRSTSALRLSFGPATTQAEIERGCSLIRESAIALQTSCLLEAPGGFEAPESLRDGIIHLRAGASNSWIVTHCEARTCLVIDPCDTLAERIEHYIRCQNLGVLAIIDTHSHADHESVRPVLHQLLSDRMVGVAQYDGLGWPVSGAIETALENGEHVPALALGSRADGSTLVLARVPTPGHTDDSHALLLGHSHGGRLLRSDVRFVFCGDTILSGGLGRTNFLVSDPEALFTSLRRLRAILNPISLLCPAHDYTNSFATHLQTEERENPLLALAVGHHSPAAHSEAIEQFILRKGEIDNQLALLEQSFQGTVCGVFTTHDAAADARVSLTLSELTDRRRQGSPLLLIDVREPQEYSLSKDWSAFGLTEAPRNVPLSRFTNFMGELAAERSAAKPEVVLLCRSGSRSLQAAKSLRRLNLAQAWNLTGGIALTS